MGAGRLSDPHSKTWGRSAKSPCSTMSAQPAPARRSQTLSGHNNRVASLVTDQGIVVADRTDLPERLPDDEDITFTARSDFSRVRREQPAQEAQSQAAPARQPQQDHTRS